MNLLPVDFPPFKYLPKETAPYPTKSFFETLSLSQTSTFVDKFLYYYFRFNLLPARRSSFALLKTQVSFHCGFLPPPSITFDYHF